MEKLTSIIFFNFWKFLDWFLMKLCMLKINLFGSAIWILSILFNFVQFRSILFNSDFRRFCPILDFCLFLSNLDFCPFLIFVYLAWLIFLFIFCQFCLFCQVFFSFFVKLLHFWHFLFDFVNFCSILAILVRFCSL